MKNPLFVKTALPLLLAASLAAVSHAATTDIAQVPLVTSAPNAVLPNLMFILDDSGSMGWDYLPDYVDDSRCRSSGANATYSGNFGAPCENEPPYRSPGYNGSYYNPAISYMPPLYANGTAWPQQNSANTAGWTSVKNDAYGVQSTGSTNLITGYADVEYCTDNTFAECLRNGNYVLPGTVNGKSYTMRRATTATGNGALAVGAPDAAGTQSRSFGPHYYTMNPGEYCDAPNLRNCQSTQSLTFKFPASVRWCDSDANARAAAPAAGTCQALQTPTYSNLRIPTKFFTPGTAGTPATAELRSTASFSVVLSGACNNTNRVSVGPLRAGTVDIFNGTTTSLERAASNLANAIVSAVAASTGYTASANGATVTITAPTTLPNIDGRIVTATRANAANSCILAINPTTPTFAGYAAATPGTPGTPGGYPGSFARVEIIPSVTSYPKASARADCTGASSCTYDEEMTNFANWFTYYRTRMQAMKSSASFAFGNVSSNYRLGYMSINNATGTDFLNFDKFELTHKENWFSKLTAARPSGTTPLRGALSRAGRLFGGRLNGTTLNGSTVVDPMQYSCQQNFTLLSTDGYWNETGTPRRLDGSTEIGNVDGSLPRPLYDGTSASNTLADVAAYYYETDLRTGTAGSGLCASALGGDLCENNVPVAGDDVARHQHMTTFTLGLGVSGYMLFDENYGNADRGDFFDVKNGTAASPANGICTWQTSGACNWPVPVNNSAPNVDDLWHAAVNGRGTYFSAKDPATLYSGLAAALAGIEKLDGAAAAATTSTPNISASDNSVFISLFSSGKDLWTGELYGLKINTETGAVSSSPDWSAKEKLDAATSRNIYTFSSGAANKLKSFTWDNLSAAEKPYFETAHITAPGRGLSQFCNFGTTCLETATQYAAAGEPLVNFLRGDRSNEGGETDTSKYFRVRAALLGDIVGSEALYVQKALYNYADAGYTAFKAGTATRRGMVYVGANDGMLHAFDAGDGTERWAYIPTMMLPKLYRLADKNYGSNHEFFVDGSPVSGDIQDGSAWKTILVGGLGAGGRGYYALDITDPDNPKGLWEFTDTNLGLTLGKPEITKLKDGTWVVIFASGYNNVSPGDGQGRLYVVRASDGTLISASTINTGVGSGTTPSGLAHIRAWVDRTDVNNTTLRVYGGDNLGNLWRFDVNGDTGASGYDAQLLATLRDGSGNAQPLTARPELGLVNGKAVVYVGTGRYLGVADLADKRQQSIYAIKDTLGSTGWGNPRTQGSFVQQTLTDGLCPTGGSICAPSETVRFGSSNAVDFATNGGWFIDLPAEAERANTDPQLALGTLVVTTNIINPGACTVGGTSFLNFFDYRTGGPVSSSTGVVSTLLGSAVATRTTVVGLPGGKVVGITRLSDATTSVDDIPIPPGSGSTRRISWRELTN